MMRDSKTERQSLILVIGVTLLFAVLIQAVRAVKIGLPGSMPAAHADVSIVPNIAQTR